MEFVFEYKSDVQSLQPSTENSTMSPLMCEVFNELRSLKEFIVSKNEECKRSVQELTNEVNTLRHEMLIYKRQSLLCFSDEDAESLLPQLPLHTTDDLEAFESSIFVSEDTAEQLRTYLLKIGKKVDVSTYLRTALKKLVTDELASKYSYKFKREKSKILDFHIIAIIKEAASLQYKHADPNQMDRIIQSFFAHAINRVHKASRQAYKKHNFERFIEEQKHADYELPTFPINHAKQLELLEHKVKDCDEVYADMQSIFYRVQGKYPDMYQSYVRAALKELMTDEVAAKYSWHGFKEKLKMKDHKLITIIRDTCHHKFENADDKTVTRIIRSHLLHARERIEKRLKTFLARLERTEAKRNAEQRTA